MSGKLRYSVRQGSPCFAQKFIPGPAIMKKHGYDDDDDDEVFLFPFFFFFLLFFLLFFRSFFPYFFLLLSFPCRLVRELLKQMGQLIKNME